MPAQDALGTAAAGNSATSDITAAGADVPKWDPSNSTESLKNIFHYVVDEAAKSTNWYWRNKRSKARLSQFIRFLAWILAAIGGLLPVIGKLFEGFLRAHFPHVNITDGLWASLLLGIAAALLGLDKAFGYSSGWARYVLTATNIRKALEEFRMDWAESMAKAGTSPTPEQVGILIERAKKFRVDVETFVLQETKDWVTEFQTSMAQMEKDVAAQVTSLKAQVDKAIAAREAAAAPGLLELTVANADKADGGKVQVHLEGRETIDGEIPSGSKTFARGGVGSGQYRLSISAKVGGKDAAAETAVVVKPGEVTKISLGLP